MLLQDERFPKIVKNLKMHKHVVAGMEQSGVYDISNADRLGISEVRERFPIQQHTSHQSVF